MPIKGLYHQLDAAERQHEEFLKIATDTTAANQREYEDRAKMTARHACRLRDHIGSNLKNIELIETIIGGMQLIDEPKSADRTLAMRHLEDASMRLHRELGDKPAA